MADDSPDPRIEPPGGEGPSGPTPPSADATPPDSEIMTVPPDGRALDDQPPWRRDFPVDWPQDHYVARRDFVKFLTLTSFAFVVGQAWIVVQNLWRRARGLPAAAKIRALDSIEPGSVVTFEYPAAGDAAVLVRARDGSLVAYGQECTHLSCAVIPRPEAGMLECPCHAGWFDLGTGRPVAGPPRRPLARILLDVRKGDVWAVGVERRTV